MHSSHTRNSATHACKVFIVQQPKTILSIQRHFFIREQKLTMRVVKGSGGGGCVARMLTHRQRQIKKITRGLVKKEKGKISETVETGSSGSEASFNKGKNAKASVVKDEFQLVEEGNEAPGQPVLAHAHRGEELDQRDDIECVAEIDHFEALPKEIESEQPRSLEVSKELQAELSVNDLRQKGKRDTRNVLDEESQEALEYDHQGDRAPSNDYRGEVQESISDDKPNEIYYENEGQLESELDSVVQELSDDKPISDDKPNEIYYENEGQLDSELDSVVQELSDDKPISDDKPNEIYYENEGQLESELDSVVQELSDDKPISDDKPNEIYYENEGQLESELDSVVQELMSLRKWREQPRADDETFEAYTKEMDAVMKLEKKLMDLERREMKKMMGKMEQREKESKRCRERDLRRRAQEDDMCEAEAETMFKSAFCCSHKAEAEAEAMFKSAKSKVRSQIQNIDVYASLPDEVKSFKTSILGVNIQVSGQDSLFADITQGAQDVFSSLTSSSHVATQ